MKATLLIIALATSALAHVARSDPDDDGDNDSCNANNCARAVTGTRFATAPIAAHKADCKSFQIITVDSDNDAPNVTPTKVPEYASACTAAAEYRSACSCWGFLPTYSTKDTDDSS